MSNSHAVGHVKLPVAVPAEACEWQWHSSNSPLLLHVWKSDICVSSFFVFQLLLPRLVKSVERPA